MFTSSSWPVASFFLRPLKQPPLSLQRKNSLSSGNANLDPYGEKIPNIRVRHRVFPTLAYQSTVKSSNFPLKMGINPKNNLSPSVKLKFTQSNTIAILMNCIIVILENYPIVSSFTECFFSIATIYSNTVQVKMLMIVTTNDDPMTIPFCTT